ncbi:MAG TPA: serine/threonine-protein kinase [Actinocrinis sp.]
MGPYRIEAVLGFGGMGRVYLARDTRDETADPVAIKVLTWNGDATAVARFRRELDAAQLVRSEGTARVLDGDPSADPPWLATEYISGPTLDRLVAELGPLKAEAAAGLAVGVAKALAAIHAAGVVHRDLKPSNIILAPDGPRVVDFGIARTSDGTPLTMAGWSMGTPGYMAPEQVSGDDPVGPQADVFALGAVLVFATTGKQPYAGDKPEAILYRLVNGSPDLSRVPEAIRPFVADCMAREAADRPTVEQAEATGLEIIGREAAARVERERAAAPDTQAMKSLAASDEPEAAGAADDLAETVRPDDLMETANADALDDIAEAARERDGSENDPDPTEHLERVRKQRPEQPDEPDAAPDANMPTEQVLQRLAKFVETANAGIEPVREPAAAGSGLDEPPEQLSEPTEPTRGQIPLWRRRAVALSVAACVIIGLGGWFAVQGIGHGTHHAGGGGATHSAQASISARADGTADASASPAATFGGGAVLTGPGCPASPYATYTVTAPNSLETDVGGGDPACGGHADAFRKSGTAAGDGAGAVWSFALGRSVTCTLSVFVADTDPSSGLAVYKITTSAGTESFQLNQAADRGKNTPAPQASVSAPDGNLTLTLTDISADRDDVNHVTASSVTATCQPS